MERGDKKIMEQRQRTKAESLRQRTHKKSSRVPIYISYQYLLIGEAEGLAPSVSLRPEKIHTNNIYRHI